MPRDKRKTVLFVVLTIVFIASGCGMKSEADVVEDLHAKSNNVESYRAHAKMAIQSGEEKHQYDIDVWYQPPHYYRVALKNVGEDVAQIILRNDEGVFVLTPKDGKHFRFQSNWPDDHGQPYLYQTLLKSIVDDENREFEAANEQYVFNVAANYKQNQALKRQRIQLDKDYVPQQMAILDADDTPLVEVTFETFETGARFDEDAFDMKRNMEDWGESTAAMADDQSSEHAKVGSLIPEWLPEGAELKSEHKVALPNGDGVLYRYGGEKPFTLLEQPVGNNIPAMASAIGEPVPLSYTVGVLFEKGDEKQFDWSYKGVDFTLRGALTKEEMIQIAESIAKQTGK